MDSFGGWSRDVSEKKKGEREARDVWSAAINFINLLSKWSSSLSLSLHFKCFSFSIFDSSSTASIPFIAHPFFPIRTFFMDDTLYFNRYPKWMSRRKEETRRQVLTSFHSFSSFPYSHTKTLLSGTFTSFPFLWLNKRNESRREGIWERVRRRLQSRRKQDWREEGRKEEHVAMVKESISSLWCL